jgi:hypothetical protein
MICNVVICSVPRRGLCTRVLCSLATVLSCIDHSVRIATKSPKVGGPLLIFSNSLLGILYIREERGDVRKRLSLLSSIRG